MFIFAVAVQGAATRYRGGETGGVGGAAAFCRPGAFGPGPQPVEKVQQKLGFFVHKR